MGDINAGNINIGNGAFTVSRDGDLYAKTGVLRERFMRIKSEGDVLKFLPFQKTGVGRYFCVTTIKQKEYYSIVSNLSFTTPDSKSSYWVVVKVNGIIVVNKRMLVCVFVR